MKSSTAIRAVVLSVMVLSCSAKAGNRVCIDPGHGGVDPGSSGPLGLILEKAVNLNVSLALRDTFQVVEPAFEVGLTRISDMSMSKSQRAAFANSAFNGEGYDYFISVHHNSSEPCPGSQGTEVWRCDATYTGPEDSTSRDVDTLMATKIYLRILDRWNYQPRGVKVQCTGRTDLLWRVKMISCLTEASFLCDSAEEQLFADPYDPHTAEEANALFHGFMSYCENGGIAQISYRYLGACNQSALIDGVVVNLPAERTWRMLEHHEL